MGANWLIHGLSDSLDRRCLTFEGPGGRLGFGRGGGDLVLVPVGVLLEIVDFIIGFLLLSYCYGSTRIW